MLGCVILCLCGSWQADSGFSVAPLGKTRTVKRGIRVTATIDIFPALILQRFIHNRLYRFVAELLGEYDISADELLNGEGKGQKTRKAKEFLLEILADGGMAQKKIEEEAEKLGIKKKTLRNAKMELGIDSVKRGNQWYWMLSE